MALTPVFLPGEFHGLDSPWGHRESDTTEQLSLTHSTGSLVCTDSALKNLRIEFNLTLKRTQKEGVLSQW